MEGFEPTQPEAPDLQSGPLLVTVYLPILVGDAGFELAKPLVPKTSALPD